MTLVDDEEGATDGRALPELSGRIGDGFDGEAPGEFTDDAIWLDNVSWTEDSTADPYLGVHAAD